MHLYQGLTHLLALQSTEPLIKAVTKLGYIRASNDQVVVIPELVLGRDVFVTLTIGSGKSLCYAALSLVFDSLSGEIRPSSIVVV